MKFFKPKDFEQCFPKGIIVHFDAVANFCNDKLEREGMQLWSTSLNGLPPQDWYTAPNQYNEKPNTHTAFMINMQTIEKCAHPPEKISELKHSLIGEFPAAITPKGYRNKLEELLAQSVTYICECGTKVIPASFKEKL